LLGTSLSVLNDLLPDVMESPLILSASIYVAASFGMLAWAWLHLERRQEEARRMERMQQILVALHFVIFAGWILRHRLGFSERVSDATTLGLYIELAGAATAFAIAATSILCNPGIAWNRFFLTYGTVAVIHGGLFGAVALRWPEALGFVPDLREVIDDRDRFGTLPVENSGSRPGAFNSGATPIE
jgi:hypothetical protein